MSRPDKRVKRARAMKPSAAIPRPRWGQVAELVEEAYELGYEDGRLGHPPVSQDPGSAWTCCECARGTCRRGPPAGHGRGIAVGARC
jgi:hypothetical protein